MRILNLSVLVEAARQVTQPQQLNAANLPLNHDISGRNSDFHTFLSYVVQLDAIEPTLTNNSYVLVNFQQSLLTAV